MLVGKSKILEFLITKNKAVCFQFSRWNDSPKWDLEFTRRTKGQQDHHGVSISLVLLHHEFFFGFYDSRHAEDFE